MAQFKMLLDYQRRVVSGYISTHSRTRTPVLSNRFHMENAKNISLATIRNNYIGLYRINISDRWTRPWCTIISFTNFLRYNEATRDWDELVPPMGGILDQHSKLINAGEECIITIANSFRVHHFLYKRSIFSRFKRALNLLTQCRGHPSLCATTDASEAVVGGDLIHMEQMIDSITRLISLHLKLRLLQCWWTVLILSA